MSACSGSGWSSMLRRWGRHALPAQGKAAPSPPSLSRHHGPSALSRLRCTDAYLLVQGRKYPHGGKQKLPLPGQTISPERRHQERPRDHCHAPEAWLPKADAGDGGTQPDSEARLLPLVLSALDRKSTRLNSSHGYISYAVFCL